MKENKDNKGVFEAVLLVLAMSLFGLFSVYFMPYLLILFPAGFVIFSIRRNLSLSGLAMIASLSIISLVVGQTYSAFLFIMFFPMTLCLSYLIKKRRRSLEILGFTTMVFFVSILLIMNLVDASGIGFVSQLEDSFRIIVETQINMFKDMELTNYELAETKDLLESAYKYILLIIPSMLLVFSFVISYLNYLLSAVGLKRIGIEVVSIPAFSRFKLPNNIVPGVFVMFLTTYIAGSLGFEYLDTITLNLVALVGFMFFIQGLAVVEHILKRMRMFIIFRFILYILFMFTAFMLTLISVIGAFDLVFDFRKLRRPKSS